MATYLPLAAAVPRKKGKGGALLELIEWIADKTKKTAQPAADFTRGFVKQAPKQVPIGGLAEGTTSTITVSLRAGMQTRYLAGLAVNTAVVKAPAAGVRVAKYIVTASVRDTIITPVYTPFLAGYRGLKIFTSNRGYISAVEKALDPKILALNRRLYQAGLAPTLGGVGGTLIRSGLGVSLYVGISRIGETVDEIHATARKYLTEAEMALDVQGVPRLSGTGPTYIPVEPSGSAPVVPPPVVPAGTVPVPPAPLPASRQRRYIPVER